MLLSLVYFALRCLLQALAPLGRGDFEREVELLVLRHQIKVLSRGVRRPPLRRRDRMPWTLKGTQSPDRRPDQRVRTIGPPSRGRFRSCSSLLCICCCAAWSA
jgi:hypothetical protein